MENKNDAPITCRYPVNINRLDLLKMDTLDIWQILPTNEREHVERELSEMWETLSHSQNPISQRIYADWQENWKTYVVSYKMDRSQPNEILIANLISQHHVNVTVRDCAMQFIIN